MYLRSSSTYLQNVIDIKRLFDVRRPRNIPREHLFRHCHLHVTALHRFLALRTWYVRRKDLRLDLRFNPLLQTSRACIDQMATSLCGIVVREASRRAIFQAGVTLVALCFDLAAFDSGSHGRGGGSSWPDVVWVCGVEWSGRSWSGQKRNAAKVQAASGALEFRHMSLTAVAR